MGTPPCHGACPSQPSRSRWGPWGSLPTLWQPQRGASGLISDHHPAHLPGPGHPLSLPSHPVFLASWWGEVRPQAPGRGWATCGPQPFLCCGLGGSPDGTHWRECTSVVQAGRKFSQPRGPHFLFHNDTPLLHLNLADVAGPALPHTSVPPCTVLGSSPPCTLKHTHSHSNTLTHAY